MSKLGKSIGEIQQSKQKPNVPGAGLGRLNTLSDELLSAGANREDLTELGRAQFSGSYSTADVLPAGETRQV